MENISSAADIALPRDFCVVERYACGVFQRSPMPISHKCAKHFCRNLQELLAIDYYRQLNFNTSIEKGSLKRRKQFLRILFQVIILIKNEKNEISPFKKFFI